MDRLEIYERIKAAKQALQPLPLAAAKEQGTAPASIDTEVPDGARDQYLVVFKRLLGLDLKARSIAIPLTAPGPVIAAVQNARTLSTLRFWARSIRFILMDQLNRMVKRADDAKRRGNWAEVESIVCNSKFTTLITLASMLPAAYRKGWVPTRPRKGKKSSLTRLPKDWREQLAAESHGQYRISTLVTLITGCRPAELEKGIQIERIGDALYATIHGAKVKETAGQPTRKFRLADHPITNLLRDIMGQSESMTVRVDRGNSVTTHMRMLGKRLRPKRKSTITAYTARHAMAADCKAAINEGADPDLASKVLGHIVDKTASYYGNRFQSGGRSVAPSEVDVPKQIKHKSRARNAERLQDGKVPGSRNKSGRKMRPGI